MTPSTRSVARILSGVLVVAGPIWPVAATSAAATACAATLPGANVAGGEFNPGKAGAVAGTDYVFPGPNEIALLRRLGLRLMRVPFAWERLQPRPGAALDEDEAARLDAVVADATAAGLTIALDAHNYGRYRGTVLTASDAPRDALPDLWRRLAARYRDRPNVVFDLMNEPHDLDADAWAAIASDTLAAIRATGARNVVLVPGTGWDGAHSWFSRFGRQSNAEALAPLARGDAGVVIEVHQYFDDDFSGTSESCSAAARVPDALVRVASWAREQHVRLMLGEFGVSRRPECTKALDDALATVERDGAVWYGWTYWAAGAWWGDYPFAIERDDGRTPQGDVLRRRAASAAGAACATRP